MSRELNFLQLSTKLSSKARSLKQEIKRIIEALLFSANEPLSLERLRGILQAHYPLSSKELVQAISDLQEDYRQQERSFQIDEIGGGYLLRTVEEMRPFLELLHQDKRGEKLSRAAAEVLAIVMHKRPVTRAEIEKIRGVDSSAPLMSLVERGLIKTAGKKECAGRPIQYDITSRFLEHFGLKDLKDLPSLGPVSKKTPVLATPKPRA